MKRYSAQTSWMEHVPAPELWVLLEDIERFLLDRLKSEDGVQRNIDARDRHGDIMATTVSEARQRIEGENTTLKHLTLTIWTGDSPGYQGESKMHAALEADDRAMGTCHNVLMDIRFSGLEDSIARTLKVDFDAWLARRQAATKAEPASGPRPPPMEASIKPAWTPVQQSGSPAVEPAKKKRSWWKPDFHSVRDNILAMILWVALVAMVGVLIAWLGWR